jgi:Flp pilus assembly protein CpaB
MTPARTVEERAYSNVVLLVLPQEVEEIVLAQEIGNISLSLRNAEAADVLPPDQLGTTVSTLFDGERGTWFLKQRLQRFQGQQHTIEKCDGNDCHPEDDRVLRRPLKVPHAP